ncbi:sucrose-6-phosphate hydrolase [Bacillus sp. UMB0899]|nr:sucrose-6-phosphate hydrolase [Bacillus sp. UMB0899]
MTRDEQLRQEVDAEIEKHRSFVEQDPYRLTYHLMPPVGLLNDPNGFIQVNGIYHLYYQWMPFKTGHGAKFWGHYSSKDLVKWKHERIALTPSEWYEKNGCYSGSAIENNGKIYAFYTGNVKGEQGDRETYQCLAISEDGIHFDKKGPLVYLPEGFTAHFRDPKVWKQGDTYFMVIGAQTEDIKGAVVLYRSKELLDWTYVGILAGGGKGKLGEFGYMFECPDLFHLDGKDILVFSPQGLESQGMRYQNIYQAGYVIGDFDPKTGEYKHNEFDELDRGFDFYAPQTTIDNQGRRLLFAWMSVPDQNEQDHPTIEYKWIHNMTLPRELKLVDGKVHQVPVDELKQLRSEDVVSHSLKLTNESKELEGIRGKSVELYIQDIDISEGWLEISISDGGRIVYSVDEKVITFERKSFVNGTTEKRQCSLSELSNLHIYIDTSSVEMFINDGQETFTSRIFPTPMNDTITFGASKDASFTIMKWDLRGSN